MLKHRSTKYYNQLSIIASIALLLLIFFQVIWLKKAIELHQEQQQQKLTNLIPDLALTINSIGHEYFHGNPPPIDQLPLDSVQKHFDHFKNEQGFSNEIYYAIYQDTTGGIYIGNDKYKNQLTQSPIRSCLSCIISFGIVTDGNRRADENEAEFAERINNTSQFQYYSPVAKLTKGGKTLWFALYNAGALSTAIRSMINLFAVNLILLLSLLYLLYYLLRSLSQYKKATQAKDDFFNNMTHEFKTPLSSIRLAARVLRENKNPVKTESYYQLIEKESKQLETQIDKLLQLSLLDNSTIDLDHKSINLRQLIQEIPLRLKPLIEDRNANYQITFDLKEDFIFGDYDHLSNSLINLVENSLKYSNPNVEIVIHTYTREKQNIIQLTDNGPGIPTQHQARIFERFYRGKKGNEYKGPGFGIGLSYVKHVIESHGGTISLNKEYTNGCQFIITLQNDLN